MTILRHCFLVAFYVATFAPIASAFVRSEIPDSYDDFEGIDLAVKLAEDGKFKLAEKVLLATPAKSFNKNEVAQFRTQANRERVLGLLIEESANGKTDLEKAALHFANAIKLSDRPEFHFDKQRVDLSRQDFSSCTDSVRKLNRRDPSIVATTTPSRIHISVKCLRFARSNAEALAVLDLVFQLQPKLKVNSVLATERVEILMDLGLSETAANFAIETMKRMSHGGQLGISNFALDLVDRVKLGDSYLNRRFAEKVLEAAQVFSTKNDQKNEQEDALAAKAKLFYSQGKSLASALAFESLLKFKTEQTSQIHLATVELYRLSGWRASANHLISFIKEPKDRLRARVTGFFERGETAKIAAMFPALDRHLLDEEEWVYLGAFARLQSGGWYENGTAAPVGWLAKLKRRENREKAAILRQMVLDCRDLQTRVCEL